MGWKGRGILVNLIRLIVDESEYYKCMGLVVRFGFCICTTEQGRGNGSGREGDSYRAH